MNVNFEDIKHGDRVTILIPNGQSISRQPGSIQIVQDWKQATGRAVMRGPHGWALNMGGRYGTPGVATLKNFVKAVR